MKEFLYQVRRWGIKVALQNWLFGFTKWFIGAKRLVAIYPFDQLSRGDSDIHDWFSLSYASYLVMPRSILQSMPKEWQVQFVDLLDELKVKCDQYGIETPRYNVNARGVGGSFIKDKYSQYDRGRRNVFK